MLNKFNVFINFLMNKNKEYYIIVLLLVMYKLMLNFFLFDKVIIENDTVTYKNLAENILNFNLVGYNGERTPGYPIFLLLAFNSIKVVVVYQHFLGIISALFWYKTILNFKFSKKNSLWIVLFLQSFLNIYFYESVILVETLCLFILSIIFYLISKDYIDNSSFKIDLIMSFLLGYITLIKPFFAFIPFLIYGFIVIKNFNVNRIINKRVVILMFTLVSYLGWSYVNKNCTGTFTSSTFLGFNLSQNCVYFAEKGPKEYEWIYKPYAQRRDLILKKDKDKSAAMAIWEIYTIGVYDYKKLSFAQMSNELAKYSVATIKNNPKDYLKQVITKSWFYFWKPNIPINLERFECNKKRMAFLGIWFVQSKLFIAFKYGFVMLIPFYLYRFFKNKVITNELILVVLVFTTSILQGLVTYGTNARYSFPFEYVMILIVLIYIKNNIKLPKFLNIF